MKTINIARTIRTSLDLNSGTDIIQLTSDSPLVNLNPRHTIISRNKYLKNLKTYASITSLPEVELPDFELEDSETEKLHKVLDIEWGANRKQLNLLFGVENDWLSVGETSLLNPSGYPYRIYNLLDLVTDNLAFEMGDSAALAVQIQDVGFGLLQGADKVNIFGSYIEEIVIDDSTQPITSIFENEVIINSESTLALPSNRNRKYVIVQNNGINDVYVSLSNLANKGSIKIRPNGHYEFDTSHVAYYGDISVFSEYNTSVLAIEGQ